jgi:hypothetical protein
LTDPSGPSSPPDWWLVADAAWAGPGRWLDRCALPMRGPAAAGGDPVPLPQLPPGDPVVEFPGRVLPGFRDAHVHSGLSDLTAVRRGGIAAVTDLGGVPEQVAALRRASADPSSGLPLTEIVGAFLTAVGGYPSDRSWAAPGSWREIRSAADAGPAVAEQAALGAVAVKVAINVTAGPVLAPPVLAAVVEAARRSGLPVIAHAEGDGAVRMGLDAGVDVLAHTPWTEALEPGLLRECARQTAWISTLAIHHPAGGGPAWPVAAGNLAGFLANGGSLRYGTDLGNGRQRPGVNPEEIGALAAVGLSIDEILAAMTTPIRGPAGFVAGVPPTLLSAELTDQPELLGAHLQHAARVFSPEALENVTEGPS